MSAPHPPARGSVLRLAIDDLAFGGRGVARAEGFVVFVEGALPGEEVRARVRQVRRGYAEAECLEVLRRSVDRAEPPCRHFGACGGCDLQHLAADAQARAKGAQVEALLRRVGGLADVRVEPTLVVGPAEEYRTRMDFDWGRDGGGRIVLGLHARADAGRLTRVDRCRLLPEAGMAVMRWLADAAPARRLAPAGRKGAGLLRRAGIRMARATGEILVLFETGRGDPPELGALGRDLMRRFPRLVGVVRREHDKQGHPVATSILAGRDHLFEEVDGDRLKIPAEAFFQPNGFGHARLRQEVIGRLDPPADRPILELYSGVGFFTLALARRGWAVCAVEESRDAVAAARENAARAGAGAIEFVHGDAGALVAPLLRSREWGALLVDPPRGGLAPDAARALAGSGVGRMVYVACDPATLARDLRVLAGAGGFTVDSVAPIDLFPHTRHIECIVRLTRPAS